jgi:hypothetical protein
MVKQQVPNTAETSVDSLTEASDSIVTKEKVGLLYFVVHGSEAIDEHHVSLIRDRIAKATAKKLFLVIDSSGGNPYAAVRIMRILGKRFEDIIGVVPHQAMSAATLMLFGTKVIYMSEESQLGPLDLPMEHPTDGSPISALDVVQSLTQLQSTAVEFASSIYREMRSGNYGSGEKVSKEKAMRLSLSHAESMVRPLIEKIDPYHRQKALRTLKIGRWFAIDLLLERMMPKQFDRAGEAASRFVTMFPDHSYSIFREDARNCYLEVIDSEKLPLWGEILQKTDQILASNKTTVFYNEVEYEI